MKSSFATMTKSELKAYLLKHCDDLEAFHILMDKVNSEPEPQFYPPEEASKLSTYLEPLNNRQ